MNKSLLAAVATVALLLSAAAQAAPVSFNFSWAGNAGYSARGQFSYDAATAPALISESGAGNTSTLSSLSVAFFDPSSNPLQAFNTVVNGVSNSGFFAFNFDTSTETLFGVFNVGGGTGTLGEQFFNGTVGGLLRLRQIDTPNADILLDSANPSGIAVSRASQVPEPGSLPLALGALFLGLVVIPAQRGLRRRG